MSKPFRFCPQCAQPLQPQMHGGITRAACPDAKCGFVQWENPTPVVAAVVQHGDDIILAHNKLWPVKFYALVTGFLEKNEVPHEAVLREVEEELGVKAYTPTLIGHYSFERMNQLIIAYHVIAEGEIVLGEELSAYIRVPPEKACYWPAATGLALRDWLRGKGHDPQVLDLPKR